MFFFLLLASLFKAGLKFSTTGPFIAQIEDVHPHEPATPWNDVPKPTGVWNIELGLPWGDLQMPLPWRVAPFEEPLALIKSDQSTTPTLPINQPITPVPMSTYEPPDDFDIEMPPDQSAINEPTTVPPILTDVPELPLDILAHTSGEPTTPLPTPTQLSSLSDEIEIDTPSITFTLFMTASLEEATAEPTTETPETSTPLPPTLEDSAITPSEPMVTPPERTATPSKHTTTRSMATSTKEAVGMPPSESSSLRPETETPSEPPSTLDILPTTLKVVIPFSEPLPTNTSTPEEAIPPSESTIMHDILPPPSFPFEIATPPSEPLTELSTPDILLPPKSAVLKVPIPPCGTSDLPTHIFAPPDLPDFEDATTIPSPSESIPVDLEPTKVTLPFPEPSGNITSAQKPNANIDGSLTQSQSVTVNDQRSGFDIILSCLPVIFVCTWVVIHPNVPDPKDSPAKLIWRRVQLMIYALILPEAMLYWSVRQFIGARRLKRAVNSYLQSQGHPLWTLTHAHFLQMGGFAISLPNGELRPIFHDTHLDYIIIPEITAEDINDKSKGDIWSKCLVVLQLFWFGLQLLVRVGEGLAISELEVVTLATSTLNVCMYGFWWYKPLNVNRPVLVSLKDPHDRTLWETPKPDIIEEEPEKERPTTDVKELATPPPSPSKAVPSARQRFRSLASSIFISLYRRAVIHPIDDMIEPLPATNTTNGRKVATFHASIQLTSESEYVMDLLASVAALVYGALHCTAWAFVFPSVQEQTLWRVSCSVVLFLPICYIMFVLVRWGFLRDRVKNNFLFRVMGYVCLSFYILAILSLLVEAVLALRGPSFQGMEGIESTLLP